MALNESNLKVLESIKTIIQDTSYPEQFLEDIIKRIEFLGYRLKDDDSWPLAFAIQKVENHIKNFCNSTKVPQGLYSVSVDRVCGELLFNMQQTGKLDDIFNSESSVKRVNVGDTTVEFGGSGNTQSLDVLIRVLMNSGEKELICYRKIKW